MADCGESSSSKSPKTINSKPVIVRVKRKLDQLPVDALWLEITERPTKKQGFKGLNISDSCGEVIKETKTKKVLVQHVETINISEAARDVLQPYLPNISNVSDRAKRREERKSISTQHLHKKQEQLRSKAREKQEDLARSARFEQIWKNRRERVDDASLREICHLYDLARVDDNEDVAEVAAKPKRISVEDGAILCNYLPLLREFIPSAADEILSDIKSYDEENTRDAMNGEPSSRADYVYDLYTVEEDNMNEDSMDKINEEATASYPLVQVDFEDDFFDGLSDSDYATDDSNAEDNPVNDYPEEEPSQDEKEEDEDPFFNSEDYDSRDEGNQYAHEVVDSDEDNEENWRWRHR